MKSLTIGGHKFKISYADIDDFGQMQIDKKEITIRKGLSKEDERQTIFHEAIHAALAISGLAYDMKGEREEAIVRALDNLFYPVAKKIFGETQTKKGMKCFD